ncbi:Factor arrest protein 11, partial [Lunasporangiospora selenospora]
ICIRPAKDQFYPLKKMLLLLWKVLRTTLGGSEDFSTLKNIMRRMVGAPLQDSATFNQKTGPLDFLVYQSEMSQKYPAYIPTTDPKSPGCSIPISTIGNTLQAKVLGGANTSGSGSQSSKTHSSNSNNGKSGKSGSSSSSNSLGNGGNQPFIFPSSSMNSSTPKSILEAEELFTKSMYLSTSTLQIYHEKSLMTERRYRLNEDVQGQSSGRALEYRQPASLRSKARSKRRSVMRRGFSGNGNQGDDEADDASEDEQASDDDQTKAAKAAADPNALGNEPESVTDKDRERIDRIEHIYREIVPRMAQIQVMLLKTLLVCIKVSGTSAAKEAATAEAEGKEPVDTFTRVNDIREHEIMAKAVSGILLLQLQHFKIYHILAFNYVCQLLVDSNCLLLLLKIFGNAENPGNIHTKNEVEEYNFFKTCAILRQSRASHPNNPEQARLAVLQSAVADLGDPIPANYVCRRNMFAIINLLRVLQKLTKHKTHRILLLVQYKSSAILKRLLKINHPDLQKFVYKSLKSQVPFMGRKWRSSHMKVITGIYIYCRSNLRDDWISGADVEKDLEEALPAEQQLRHMIRHYHDRVHPHAMVSDPSASTNSSSGSAQAKKSGSASQFSGPRYDWQEMYEAHASIPDLGAVNHSGHARGQRSSGGDGNDKSDGEESTHSASTHHSSRSGGSSSHSMFGEQRREISLSDIELEPGFEENYEEWLEAEVFGSNGNGFYSTVLDTPPFKYNDFYFDDHIDTPFLQTPGDGSGWDTPAVMPSDDDDIGVMGRMRSGFNFGRWEDEELFKQIDWTPNRYSEDASVEEQYYLDEVAQNPHQEVYYTYDYDELATAGAGVDADTGLGVDSGFDGMDAPVGSGIVEGDAGPGSGGSGDGRRGRSNSGGSGGYGAARRRSRPLRVRKSDMGTEWIEDDAKEEVMHAYGPSLGTAGHHYDRAESDDI